MTAVVADAPGALPLIGHLIPLVRARLAFLSGCPLTATSCGSASDRGGRWSSPARS